jgi:DNA-directed RNA polymerase specialized sigma24 family protein
VEKYEQKLLKYILRITNVSYEDAENILQEVFIKAYTKINSYNSDY